jgi:DNA-binding XRE family transcriptional regulator
MIPASWPVVPTYKYGGWQSSTIMIAHSICRLIAIPYFHPLRCLFFIGARFQRPIPSKYPNELNVLGDHFRKRRLDLGLLQKQAAEQLRVDTDTVFRWESNETAPSISKLPAIMRFLAYDPYPMPNSFPEELRQSRNRRVAGISHYFQCIW